MVNLDQLQNWQKKRYFSLLDHFKDKKFSFQEAHNLFKTLYNQPEEQTRVILSELNQAGLLKSFDNPESKKAKLYQLVPFVPEKKQISKDELIALLSQAADIIRTRVDYTFILILLFYKAYSDKWQKEYERIKKKFADLGWRVEDAEKEAEQPFRHAFNFPKEYLWQNLRKSTYQVSERLSIGLRKLAELNPDYQDIFSQFDFYQFTSNPENAAILNQLIELFSKFDFSEVEGDILGDAYEWILKYFAPAKAKEGEVYTPREVVRLMVELLAIKPKSSVYDPALGSAGMLIVAYQYLKEKFSQEEADTLLLKGQEYNLKTLALAKMNMLLHQIKNFDLKGGDSLLYPKFKEGERLELFDYVLANPPWNQKGYGEDELKKADFWQSRFSYGFSTKQSADWVWIQHMLALAKEKVAVVIDTGAISRGGRELEIRRKIVEVDLIEAVILLPEKLFYNTGAPAVIIVFNKNKNNEKKSKILLINASKEFQPGKKQNILSQENIKKILEVYQNFQEREKFSQIITLEEAKQADYNLSPSRFISIFEEEKYRSMSEIKVDLERLEEEKEVLDKKIKEILAKM